MNHRFLYSLFASLFFLTPYLGTAAQESEPNPIWYIFADELESFVEKSQALYDRGLLTNQEDAESHVEELNEIAKRIAGIYFEELEAEIRPDLEQFLGSSIKSNEHLGAFFILLGNGFHERAEVFIQKQKEKNSNIRRWSVIGGTILGFSTGAGILYFKPTLIEGALKKGLLVIGLGAAGAGVGLGAGYVTTSFILKAEPGVKNAKDFIERYPTGTDFIDEYKSGNQDIARWEEELEGLGG